MPAKQLEDLIDNILGVDVTGEKTAALGDLVGVVQAAFPGGEVILQLDRNPPAEAALVESSAGRLVFNLRRAGGSLGRMTVLTIDQGFTARELEILAVVLANTLAKIEKHAGVEKQLARLNTYLTISTSIQNNLDLDEQLTAIIFLCMDSLAADGASVLLLCDDRQQLEFHTVGGGDESTSLVRFKMPADQGIAGLALREGSPVIVNNAQEHPLFFREADQMSGFFTRNIIAAPLVAGDEVLGVLEIVNKNDGTDFSEDDGHLAQDIANEVSFAIRNTKIFEYTVSTYCKILQGEKTCAGCRRPLKSWTPCRRQIMS
jgi:hypothetical protein